MVKHNSWRYFSLLVVVAMLVALVPTLTSAQEPAPAATQPQAGAPEASKTAPRVEKPTTTHTSEQDLAKLDAYLRDLVETGTVALPAEAGLSEAPAENEPLIVHIVALPETQPKALDAGKLEADGAQAKSLAEQLKPYFVDGKVYAQPSAAKEVGSDGPQLQLLVGLIRPNELMKVASNPLVVEVTAAIPERQEYEPVPADDSQPAEPAPGPEDWTKLRDSADQLREGSKPWDEAKAFGDGRIEPETEDWFEVMPEGPHKAMAAWDRGYRGEGVAVAVIDDGVDMAHPDLMGTQRIYNSVAAPQYNGWPMVMDPFTMRAYFYDLLFGTTYVSDSFGGSTYVDTSATPQLTQAGTGISTFEYTPLIDFGVPGLTHTYVIANAMTKSGVVHVGTHSDESLRDYVWGEKVAVLVGDPNVAGVYDTVWVDLDDDYDFRDEKPLTRANPADPATYNNMIAYRDMNSDGKADLSGGMLYWIADGVNWVPGMDWLFYPAGFALTPPGAGDLVAIHGPWDSGYSHGTQCASNVVGQGNIDGLLPKFSDLPGTGEPAAAVYGAAPEADLVPMNTAWGFSGRITYRDAYLLAAIGWDGIDQYDWHWLYGPGSTDTDAIQITSNSYGWSDTDNDGWDLLGQYIWQIQRYFAPSLQFLFSTGNGAPGYGTAAPPSPGMGIAVGSSTEYGSTGWDTITSTAQINFNDYTAFSNSGPSAREGAGVDVLAGGSYAAGAEELNYYAISSWGVLDGNISWATWGGTSRSSPTAMGNLALIYQAYKAKHGVWPTAEQARALLMSSATDINNDVLRQGAGSVNADRGTLVAGGHYGVYMDGGSASWVPGDYRGTDYPGFAHLVEPGQDYDNTFTVHNDSAADISVGISDQALMLVDSQELALTVTPQMTADESVYGAANRDNFYKAFQYMIPLTATPGMDDSMYNVVIPPDTDLMIVRQIFPYDEFDPNGDYVYDNRFYLMVYNWRDQDSDGLVWDDKNANGVVNFINGTEWTSVDVGPELAWDDPRTELDRWEYERYGYNRPTGNSNELTVQDPLNRMHDGMFIGLRHLFTTLGASQTVHLRYRIEFYSKADVPWLSTDAASLLVPAGGSADFDGQVQVPADMPPGVYEAAIEVTDPGTLDAEPHTTVVPVVIHVAAAMDGMDNVTLGGEDSYAYDEDNPYNNAAVRGYQDWGWREESGDWRFFYLDLQNECLETVPPVTILDEDFEGGSFPPPGWTVVDHTGNGEWDTSTAWGEANYTGGTAEAATVDSDSAGMVSIATELRSPPFDLPSSSPLALHYKANYQNFGGIDSFDLDISTDGGSSWTNLLSWNEDHGGFYATPGEAVDINLSAYAGMSGLMLRWHYYDANWAWYVQIDDVWVGEPSYCAEYAFPPEAHVLVRDVWDDAAPHTDIDTVILGPTASGLTDLDFGVWGGDWSDPSFFGDYVLDTVAKSVVDRSGRATWHFNTTSGGAEEWVAFPAGSEIEPMGGLHEVLEHNVVFEGDQFDAVFTKTVGLLMEDEHAFAIDTYVDQGVVGQVTLTSTIALNGLLSSGYLVGTDETAFLNEPIPFVASNVYEWTDVFVVEDGVSIELTTSSADIPDIDLGLFYWTGTTWQQRGSSGGSDANEHIFLANPEDGNWLVAVNNWSGPAGTFNLWRVVQSKVPGLTVTGASPDPVPAGTGTTLTIHYDYPMEPGVTYDGMVLAGPPEAPQLKQIPVSVTRLPESAAIQKKVDVETTFAGNELKYTINLYNLSDPLAQFEFSDPIPENTTFVDVNNATYDLVEDEITWSGTMPLSAMPSNSEGFEGGAVPPSGWTLVQTNANETWQIDWAAPPSGSYNATCFYDAALGLQDEWLVSPRLLALTGGEPVSLWTMGSYVWGVDPYDNYDLNVWLVVDDPGGGDDILLGNTQDDWPTTSWIWTQSTFNLPASLPAGDLSIGIQYYGADGAQAGVDDIELPGTLDTLPEPARVIELTVLVDDPLAAGTLITNTGSLVATHELHETQVEPTVEDSAVSQISLGPSLATSYKVATEEVVMGGAIDYEVHVINTGTELVEVTFTDPMPAGTTYAWHDTDPPNQHLSYDAVADEVTWTGNVAPGDEWVFSFGVTVNPEITFGSVITNTATLAWNSQTMDMSDTTLILAPYIYYFPIVAKSATN